MSDNSSTSMNDGSAESTSTTSTTQPVVQTPVVLSDQSISSLSNAFDKHLNANGGEDLSLILQDEITATTNLQQLYDQYKTYDNIEVIAAGVRVLESWIGLYKLAPMDDLITKIEPFAAIIYQTNNDDPYYVKIIQLKAFLRFKQHRFEDALQLFEQFKSIVGPSPELLENMGHTHNALGNDIEAVKLFKQAIEIQTIKINAVKKTIRDKIAEDRQDQLQTYRNTHNGNEPPALTPDEIKQRQEDELMIEELATASISMQMGGLLLGVGTSLKKQGNLKESLVYLDQALKLYKKRFNNQDHSLIAKTLTSISDLCLKLNNIDAALEANKEAVRIFKVTCGNSPLTANALQSLGTIYITKAELVFKDVTPESLGKLTQNEKNQLLVKNWVFTVEAILSFDEAFELHCNFDTPDCNQILRLGQLILDHKTQLIDRPFPKPTSEKLQLIPAMHCYVESIKTCITTIKSLGLENTDEYAVLCKSFGEILLLAAEYRFGLELLYTAKTYFKTVTDFDCTKLIEQCNGLLQIGIQCAERDKVELSETDFAN